MRAHRLIPIAFFALAAFACAQPQHVVPPAKSSQAQPAVYPLDINTATFAQINALPGFGPVYTRRVIAGRPYSAKNQLFTRGIVPLGTYQRVASLIVAHRASH
jgi:DNA uptake protein ComE-like DNA-binding protein